MAREDPEAILRAMTAPLGAARPGEPLPGVPFSAEAVANAFVMLGLLPENRAEQILAEQRPGLEAKGFRIGLLTGELSVRPGAHGFQDAQAAGRDRLTSVPLAVVAGPAHLALGGVDLSVAWVTLTPRGVRLDFRATRQDSGRMAGSLGEMVRAGLAVTDNTGQRYQVPSDGVHAMGVAGRRWEGEMLAEPVPRPGGPGSGETVRWLEFATEPGPARRVIVPTAPGIPVGPAAPPWPAAAECYLAELARVTSMSIGSSAGRVDLDTARIVAAVADALLRAGALPPDSAVLTGGTAAGDPAGWQQTQMHQWGRQAWQRARQGEPARAGLAARLPLRQATAVIESIAAHEDLVFIQLYGHPWVSGEYWPMITPCFQVRAVDDTGGEHDGVRGSGGGSPEASYEFWFWPPVPPAARRLRVIVSTLWEAAWAEIDIPGRPGS